MKRPILPLVLLAFSATAAHAATIAYSAVPSRNGFDMANGTDLPAGSLVRVGTFNISDATIAANAGNVAFLDSNFTEAAFTTIGTGVSGAAGHFSASTPSGYANAATLAGKQIYYWAFFSTDITNETTSINTATQIGIFYEPLGSDPDWAFPTVVDTGSTIVSLSDLADSSTSFATKRSEAQTVVGAFGPGTSASGKPAFTLQTVPEPYTIALLVPGIVGLLGYRRLRRTL